MLNDFPMCASIIYNQNKKTALYFTKLILKNYIKKSIGIIKYICICHIDTIKQIIPHPPSDPW